MAKKIAWANYFTDELDDAKDYGIQTQCGLTGSWNDAQIQMSVIIPFHFMPGEDPEWPWKTVANNKRAGLLVKEALESKNPLRLGIALHTLQDTYSHQGFSGWREDRNSCYVWYAPLSAIPNVGHAEMRTAPDVVSEVWTDPRGEKTKVKNSDRAMKAAARTFQVLAQWNGTTNAPGDRHSDRGKIFPRARSERDARTPAAYSRGDNRVGDQRRIRGRAVAPDS